MAAIRQTVGECSIPKYPITRSALKTPRRKTVALSTAALGAAALVTSAFDSRAAAQNTTLFTTTSDFTGWVLDDAGRVNSVAPTTAYDFDLSTTNGAGNSSNPGGASTAGALSIDTTGKAVGGYGNIVETPDLSNNQTFLSAFDPGATAGAGTVAFSGNLSVTYTVPAFAGSNVYYQLGIGLHYTGNGEFGGGGPFFAPNANITNDGTVDGSATFTEVIPYTINKANAGAFAIQFLLNAGVFGSGVHGVDDVATQPIFIDALSVPSPVILPPNNATWAAAAGGSWETATNWVASASPNNAQSNATFDTDGGTITTTPTVTLAGPKFINNLTFNNPAGYVITGNNVTVSGAFSSLSGTNTLSSMTLPSSATMSVSAGSVVNVGSFTHDQYSNIIFAGGGTINLAAITDPQGNAEFHGDGTTVNFTGTVPATNSWFYDMTLPNANDVLNLGSNNSWNNNSMGGLGTVILGTGTTLDTAQYGGFYFGGALSGSGTVVLGSLAASSNNTTYTGTFAGTSPNFSGAINVTFLQNLGVANGATLGNASVTNTITLDSGSLEAIGAVVVNGTAATPAPAIVTLAQNITIEDTLAIANNVTTIDTESDIGYNNNTATLPVGNTLTLSGQISGPNTLMKTGMGTLILAHSNSYTGPTDVTQGTLVAGATGALPANSALSITNSSVVQLATGSGGQTLSSLSIDGTSKLDVGNNHLFVHYGANADPIASIAALLSSGYAGGTWNGASGIVSNAAAANHLSYGLGYADSADAGNPAGLSSGTIEVAYTLLGDANLDYAVNGVDFGILAANFNKGVTGWDKGDFNYDNAVNGVDFGFLAANFNKGASGVAIGGGPLSDPALVAFAEANGLMADVPEPVSIGLLSLGTVGMLVRRRRAVK
jgi:autotransporter-associated beta strand protein